MKTVSSALDPVQSWWLLAAGTAALLPLVPHQPPWLIAAAAVALALRAWLIHVRDPVPSRWVLSLTVVPGVIGVITQYRTLFGQNPGVALLVILLALKQLESGDRRDAFVIVLLCYFLLLASFFYSQTIPAAVVLVVAVAITTAALASLSDSRQPPLRLLRLSGLMLAQALPLLLILFVLFPRVSGPLWGLPHDAFSAQTGLSDSMSPGTIGSLVQSDAIAFRVKFAGTPPPQERLYWRGPVLTLFDGTTWRPARSTAARQLPYEAGPAETAYEITLEANNRPWLFALDFPTELPPDAVMASNFQMLATAPVVQRRRYELRSRLGVTPGTNESPWVLRLATTLPRRGNPRTLALGRSWRARHASDVAILKEAVAFLVGQRLAYTLDPPPLGSDSVDEFLFDTKQGFCEHFAGAFVFAMRAAGVPARVVTGYQGGEINPVDGYLEVRQWDAHAWAEVWLAGRGWTRIDPTAAGHPLRIERNLAAAVPGMDHLPLLMRPDWAWLRGMRQHWDALANDWNQRVLGYTPQRQRDFLASLGMPSPDWRNMTVALAVLGTAVSLALTAWALHRRRRVDPVQALWLRLVARLARRGLPRHPWEGPGDYAERVAAARPEIAAAVREIAALYTGLRYGRGTACSIETLRSRVAAFKP
jgi:transglutaminase-like putative cysteine protease